MRLEPTAKPVRIRISSGGREHSDLSTLRGRFDTDDVAELCEDGRMQRWLLQQNESDTYARLVSAMSLEDPASRRLNTIQAFFPADETESLSGMKDILEYWGRMGYTYNIECFLDKQDEESLEQYMETASQAVSDLARGALGKKLLDSGRLKEAARLALGNHI